jgi:DNA polymerase-3 subunit gamma/tau
VPASDPTPVPASADAAPGGLDAAAVRRVWPSILDAVKKRKRTTHVLLSEATVVAVDGSALVLTHANAPLVRRLSEDQNVAVVRESLREVLGVDWQLRYEGGGQPAAARGGAQSRGVSAASSASSPAAAPVRSTVADQGWPEVRAVPTGGQAVPPSQAGEQAPTSPAQSPTQSPTSPTQSPTNPAQSQTRTPPQTPSARSPRDTAPADGPPLEEPPPEDEPDYEPYDAYDSSAAVSAGPPPVSPEDRAFALLEEQLGARRLDDA